MNTKAKEGQDLFALYLNKASKKKEDKTFIDIGCADIIKDNNTYYLESQNWQGVLLDKKIPNPNDRNSICYECDVKKVDWEYLIHLIKPEFYSNFISYISLDVDDANIHVINNFPFDKYDFGCMTYETDKYNNKERKEALQNFLNKNPQYFVLFEDVKVQGLEFEDWIINTKYIDIELKTYKSLDWQECIKILSDII